jgi:hypothetical protein
MLFWGAFMFCLAFREPTQQPEAVSPSEAQ